MWWTMSNLIRVLASHYVADFMGEDPPRLEAGLLAFHPHPALCVLDIGLTKERAIVGVAIPNPNGHIPP